MLRILCLSILSVALCSCGADSSKNSSINHEETTSNGSNKTIIDTSEMKRLTTASKVIYTMPSPMELAMILKKSGTNFQADLLHDAEKAKSLIGNYKVATNLGVYFSDLSYSSQFGQPQLTMNYMASIQRLADELGMSEALNEEIISRIENNQENKDSLISIVSEVYFEIDASLQDDAKQEVAAMMFAGAWIEGFYIASSLSKDSEVIASKMVDQKLSLKNLTKLVAQYPENQNLMNLNADLMKLYDLIPSAPANKEKPTVNSEGGKNVISFGGKSTKLTPEQLNSIHEEITSLRNKML